MHRSLVQQVRFAQLTSACLCRAVRNQGKLVCGQAAKCLSQQCLAPQDSLCSDHGRLTKYCCGWEDGFFGVPSAEMQNWI